MKKSEIIKITVATPDGKVETFEVDKFILIVPDYKNKNPPPGYVPAEIYAVPAMPPPQMRIFVEFALQNYADKVGN